MKKKTPPYAKNTAWEKLQLTLLYFFLILFLFFRAKVLLGRSTGIVLNLLPFSNFKGNIPGLKGVAKPENLLVLYAGLLRPITSAAGQTRRFSYLVKFNLILVLLIEMIQFLFLDYWDVIFKKVSLTNNFQLKKTNTIVYSFIFSLFAMLYSYCYLVAMMNKIPKFPGILNIIPRSAQYWIRSKTL